MDVAQPIWWSGYFEKGHFSAFSASSPLKLLDLIYIVTMVYRKFLCAHINLLHSVTAKFFGINISGTNVRDW